MKKSRWPIRIAVRFGIGFIFAIAVVVWLWSIGGAYCLEDRLPQWIKSATAFMIAIGIPVWFFFQRRSGRNWIWQAAPLVAVFLVLQVTYATVQPTHDRVWSLAQQELPFAGIDGDQIEIHGIRSFRYGPVQPSRMRYSDQYDLSKLKTVWFGVDRFTQLQPMAHTFLSFEFAEGSHRANFLTFSVETRKEIDEPTYSPLRGLYKNYETIYVIADEQDVFSVRTGTSEHVIQLYPIAATPALARELFVDLLQRANEIRQTPEFYNTLTSNCTNNLVYHTNKIVEEPISAWQRGVVFPGYSDWLAMKLGLIDTELPLEEAREAFRIDQRVKTFDGKSDFSEHIRGR